MKKEIKKINNHKSENPTFIRFDGIKNLICLTDNEGEVAFIYGKVSKTFLYIKEGWEYLKRGFELEFSK